MATDVFPFAVWLSGTNQNSIPANDNSLRVEVITGPALSILSAQPSSPSEGDQHILGPTPTGALWSSFAEGDVVIFKGGAWFAFSPYPGWMKFNEDDGDTYQWDGGWAVLSGGGGGGGAWGSITGTLSAQTDLQAALDTKASISYVDNLLQGLSWKKAVRAATTANGTLATAFENGDAIDGVTLATGDRILLKNQTTASENGIYIVNATGAPTRATDADTGAEMVNATVFVSEGSSLADTQWTCITNAPITMGATSIAFAQLSGGTGFANPMTTAGDIITGGASGAPQRLAAATNGWVLTLVSGAPAWAAASGGGLTGFTAALSTASPNATVNASSLIPSGGTTNQVGVYGQKGTGAIQAQVADGSPAGGNVRGVKATDWQTQRAAADQVASGDYSSVLGGYNNKASGAQSAVLGGSANTASGSNSVASGSGSTASGYGAHSFGTTASASGAAAFALGDNVSANADFSQAGGAYSTTRGVIGAFVHGSHTTSVGRHQRGDYIGGITTTNATQTAITSNGAAPVANNQIPVSANYGASTIKILVVARKLGGSSDSKHWEITLGAMRDASTGSTAIVGTPSVIVIGETAGASGWACDVVADAAAGAVSVRATGAASTSIRWSFRAQTTECEYAP